ncbi:MAG: M23 family metallopeptidase [Gemmatimonadota bacterium]
MATDDRKLTVIIVPHGDLETRNLEISYRKLKILLGVAAAAVLAVVFLVAFMFPIMVTASRVRPLERELAQLYEERARFEELARTLEQVEAQYERVRELLGADAPTAGDSLPLLPPLQSDPPDTGGGSDAEDPTAGIVDTWPLGSAGYITQPLLIGATTRDHHPGLDIAVPRNTHVRAAGPGVVQVAGEDSVYGLHVTINHGRGLETIYGHASRLFVSVGDTVRRGRLIAFSGSTGRSTAPHLHFEVRLDGMAVDPLTYVRQP